MADEEIVKRISKQDDWQKEYILLCCIELEKRGIFDKKINDNGGIK